MTKELEELLKEFRKEDNENKKKSEKVSKVIDEVLPLEEKGYVSPYDAVDVLAPALLGKFNFEESENAGENKFIEFLLDKHIQSVYPKFKDNTDFLESYLREHGEQSFGDADAWSKLILDTEDKTVIEFSDVVTCSEENHWLIINDKKRRRIHVRIIWDYPYSDNRKGNEYVNRPNLKWWKERDFNVEYIEELHMTRLGGVYGDARDKGYVLTYSYGYGRQDTVWHVYSKFVHIFRNINWAVKELRKDENRTN